MKLNLSKKNFCLGCGKNISLQKAFCNNKCKDIHFENLKIQVPNLFVKRLIQHFDEPVSRKNEILKFAQIHSYNFELVEKKSIK
jgi:predicted amidophosphoribosyltransferase